MQPSEPKKKKLTPEEEAALAAEQAAAEEPLPPPPGYIPGSTYVPPAQQAAPPATAPVEPGMYTEPYTGPGSAVAPPPRAAFGGESGRVEPGMYEPPYHGPGMYEPHYDPLEPGIYEETYRQPGQHTPRPASTYYGGEVWPPYNTGAAHPNASGRPLPGVFTYRPGTGAPPERRFIPQGGTEILPGPERMTESDPMPGATSTGDVFGAMSGEEASAPRTAPVTLGPTPLSLYYRMLSHDPGVVPTSRGKLIERRDLAEPVVDRLSGLFGGGGRKSSQPMPLPPRTKPARTR